MNKLAVILTTNKIQDGVSQYSSFGYDLFTIDYETDGTYKYHGIKNLINSKDLLNKYDYFWFPDYDVEINDLELHNLVKLAKIYNFALCQPSVSHDSYLTWDITRHVPNSIVRESNFVEVGCPLFTQSFLKEVIWTFDINYSSWGLDYLWVSLSGNNKLGIIDLVQVQHRKPITSHTWILPNGKTPLDEMNDIIKKYNL
jgi:hypothetical protein